MTQFNHIHTNKALLNTYTQTNADIKYVVDRKSALTGTNGTPSSINKYVTNSDPRLTDSRTPVSTLVSKSSNYTLTSSNYFLIATGGITVGLPDTTGLSGKFYTIKRNYTSASVIVKPTGVSTIDNETSFTLSADHTAINLVTDGSNWFIY